MTRSTRRTTQTDWNALTERIYQGVGTQINETRKIQFHLRFILAAALVAVVFAVYMVALYTA